MADASMYLGKGSTSMCQDTGWAGSLVVPLHQSSWPWLGVWGGAIPILPIPDEAIMEIQEINFSSERWSLRKP